MKSSLILVMISLFYLVVSCESDEVDYYPKPMGFMRLDFPDRVYSQYEGDCAYSFEMPEYFEVVDKPGDCNKDVNISRFNALLYLTYIPIDTNLTMNIEYSRKLVYDHSIKADEIKESAVELDENAVYGMRYRIIGNAASPYQFYVTDSTQHFLRGALYFNAAPNYDSLKPSLEYILEDIEHLIETVSWPESDSLI